MNENAEFVVEEKVVLEKFDGAPHPENLVERIHLLNGEVTKHEFFENGELVETEEGGVQNSAN